MHIVSNYSVFDRFRSDGSTNVSVNYKLIRFQPPSGFDNNTCQEILYGKEKEKFKPFFSQCKNIHSIREVRNDVTDIELTQEADFLNLFYTASNETTGGIFWIQIKGKLFTQTLYRINFLSDLMSRLSKYIIYYSNKCSLFFTNCD